MKKESKGFIALIALCAVASSSRFGPLSEVQAARAHSARDQPTTSDHALTQEVASSVAFREAHGLRSDDSYVSSLLDFPPSNNSIDLFSVPLSDSELAEMISREERGSQAYLIRQDALLIAPAQFAGLYLDQKGGGRIRVLFTEIPGGYAERIQSLVSFGSFVDLVQVKYSMQYLEELQRSAMSSMPTLRSEGIMLVSSSIHEDENRVGLGVEGGDSRAKLRLTELFGDAVVVVDVSASTLLTHGG